MTEAEQLRRDIATAEVKLQDIKRMPLNAQQHARIQHEVQRVEVMIHDMRIKLASLEA